MVFVLERALDSANRERLMAQAPLDDDKLKAACEFVLELPRGTGLRGVGFNHACCTKRWRSLSALLHPDKLVLHPSLASRADDFEEALKMLNTTWDVLKVLLQKSEGTYVPTPPRNSPQPPDPNGGTPPPTPGGRSGRGRGSGGRGRGGRSGGRGGGSPRSPPPPPKTPVELFLDADPQEDGEDVMAVVLSITASARQRPKAKNRPYKELVSPHCEPGVQSSPFAHENGVVACLSCVRQDEKTRKEMALYLIDTAAVQLEELERLGRMGEWGFACEIGKKMRKHHGQGGMEVLTTGNVDTAVAAMEALLNACALPDNMAATLYLEVHDKGADRSKEECIGYSLKDMPDAIMADGTERPRAVQGKYHARPRVFYWRGNISDERAEECTNEYRKNNQQTGGPCALPGGQTGPARDRAKTPVLLTATLPGALHRNFHKTGFAYGSGPGDKERDVILLKNLMTWPVTHARRHGWLELADSFLKLLCLMFESGEYELGLELVEKGGYRSEARMEALHKLNLNCGFAATKVLMKIVVCGIPQFEESSAAFLVTFRAPWRLSVRVARQMDRAEFMRYITERRVPLRLSFVPTSRPRRELRGVGFTVDLNTGRGWEAGMGALHAMDAAGLQVSTACMYEHMHLHDEHGHVACGLLACVCELLTGLVQLQGSEGALFFESFASFVQHELELRFFVDVNTGEFAEEVSRLLSGSSTRSIQDLLRGLEVPGSDALAALLDVPVQLHDVAYSAATLCGMIKDSTGPKAGRGLHLAIGHGPRDSRTTQPLSPGATADMSHHFLAVWGVHGHETRPVD